ncbi:peptidase A24A prepilin type IV [Methylobacterium sp. 4-46]|uniref:prepilin peptidase n=1 Tax=unclassified Methylobacterium TaxID=2615210 RepID=UPI000152E049|nr:MULTISPECIES: A24 family peptidase [Methylobacterium]ACA16487.1 peptidase A24A prepilin type IV [Methylobacterium sp. 4-46]WFT82197.1 A24 family peptidase [Methylobacterium nodulans]
MHAADPTGTAALARRAGRLVLPGVALALAPTLWLGSPEALSLVLALALLAAVAQVVWQDVVSLTIADGTVAAIGLVAAAARLGAGEPRAEAAALAVDGLVCGGGLWLIREAYYRRRGHDGIGLGDVKLAAAGGLLTGLEGFAWALLLASLGGLAVVAASRLRARPIGRGDKIPFGAFLAPALLAVWFAGGPP